MRLAGGERAVAPFIESEGAFDVERSCAMCRPMSAGPRSVAIELDGRWFAHNVIDVVRQGMCNGAAATRAAHAFHGVTYRR